MPSIGPNRREKLLLSLALGLFSLVLLAPGIGSPSSFTHYMEHAYSAPIPLEMLGRGDWATPWLDGEPHLLKPPLMWWLILASYKFFGVSLWAMRLPAVLSTAGAAVAALWLGWTLGLGTSRALAAALLTVSSAGFFSSGRIALIDVPLSFLMILAFYALSRALVKREGRWLWAAGAASGLSMMLKWPVAPAVLLPALGLWILWQRDWKLFKEMGAPAAGGAALCLALALPWNIEMARLYGKQYWDVVFLGEMYSVRFLTSGHIPLGVFILMCLGAVLPWTLLLLSTIRGGRSIEPEDKWILTWTAAALLPFLVQKTKTERYVLFMIPGLMVWLLRRWDWGRRPCLWAARLTAVLFAAMGALLLGFSWRFGFARGASAVACAAAAVSAWALLRGKDLALAGGGAAVLLSAVFGFIHPRLGQSEIPEAAASGPVSVFARTYHGLACLPVLAKRSLWSFKDISSLRLALARGHDLALCEEDMPRLEALLEALGGAGHRVKAEWTQGAFMNRSLGLFRRRCFLLSGFYSPSGFEPPGRRFFEPRLAVKAGSYLVSVSLSCEDGCEKDLGFKEMGWILLRSLDDRFRVHPAVYKRELLRANPYWYTWPMILDKDEVIEAQAQPWREGYTLNFRELRLAPIPRALALSLR
ncbi:MAG: glycosyltransferase family 39 protein [Elusimicrobia bacterium]|nr:glycosyltransferase family 39 protein [Elusimicrobiota bacterium]